MARHRKRSAGMRADTRVAARPVARGVLNRRRMMRLMAQMRGLMRDLRLRVVRPIAILLRRILRLRVLRLLVLWMLRLRVLRLLVMRILRLRVLWLLVLLWALVGRAHGWCWHIVALALCQHWEGKGKAQTSRGADAGGDSECCILEHVWIIPS